MKLYVHKKTKRYLEYGDLLDTETGIAWSTTGKKEDAVGYEPGKTFADALARLEALDPASRVGVQLAEGEPCFASIDYNPHGLVCIMTDPKIEALAKHFNVSPETVTEGVYPCYTLESVPGEYLVYDEAEANDAWDESLENYLDECILPELPAVAQQYFDRDAWKHDARSDGRGHSLASYDGEEHEVKIDGEWYYIYRVN